MTRFLQLTLAALFVGLISSAAQAQPFRDRGYHPIRHYHPYHPHYDRHVLVRHGDYRR